MGQTTPTRIIPRNDIGRYELYFEDKKLLKKKVVVTYREKENGKGEYLFKIQTKSSRAGTPLKSILEDVILPIERERFGIQSVEDLPRRTGRTQREIDKEANIERQDAAIGRKHESDEKVMQQCFLPYYEKYGEWPKEYHSRKWCSTINLSSYNLYAQRLRYEYLKNEFLKKT